MHSIVDAERHAREHWTSLKGNGGGKRSAYLGTCCCCWLRPPLISHHQSTNKATYTQHIKTRYNCTPTKAKKKRGNKLSFFFVYLLLRLRLSWLSGLSWLSWLSWLRRLSRLLALGHAVLAGGLKRLLRGDCAVGNTRRRTRDSVWSRSLQATRIQDQETFIGTRRIPQQKKNESAEGLRTKRVNQVIPARPPHRHKPAAPNRQKKKRPFFTRGS